MMPATTTSSAATLALLLHHALAGHAAGFSSVHSKRNVNAQRFARKPAHPVQQQHDALAARGPPHRRRARHASTRLLPVRMSLDEDDSSGIAGDVNIEPNLLTGDELDLPSSSIENIRGGGADDDIMAVTVDGAMLASKDFGWMLFLGISTFVAQVGVLRNATSLNAIFATFIFRLGVHGPACALRAAMGKVHGPACALRAAMGRGAIGKAMSKTWNDKKASAKGQ